MPATFLLTYWSGCTGPSGQFSLDILAHRAILVLLYWPFGQFSPDLLALRASLLLLHWPFEPDWS